MSFNYQVIQSVIEILNYEIIPGVSYLGVLFGVLLLYMVVRLF